jgi:hypothetical protein
MRLVALPIHLGYGEGEHTSIVVALRISYKERLQLESKVKMVVGSAVFVSIKVSCREILLSKRISLHVPDACIMLFIKSELSM